jgi:butyrate response factor 1
MAGAMVPMPVYGSPSPNRMQVLANGDIVDCGRLPQTARNNLYKTELCKHFTENGACRYGSKCQFAHGEDELRGVLRHPKYKTTRCKAFISTGKCMYGARCRFIHHDLDDDELRDNMSSTASESDDSDLPLKDLLVNPYGNALEPIDLSTPFGGVKQVTLMPLTFSGLGASHSSFREPFGEFQFESLGGFQPAPFDSPLDADASAGTRAERSSSSASSRLSIFQRICREDE